jgi:hypothetical protein
MSTRGKMIFTLSCEQQFGRMLDTSMLWLGVTTHTTILSKIMHPVFHDPHCNWRAVSCCNVTNG